MKLLVQAALDYDFAEPTDVLLQVEAAALPEQRIDNAVFELSPTPQCARVTGHDEIGERVWLQASGRLSLTYHAAVTIDRAAADLATLAAASPRELPGETVEYLLPSRYCPSDLFGNFVDAEFAGLAGGARIAAIRDWIEASFAYTPVSTAETTALDTFIRREGICRDYAHVLITLARASGVPARIASVYALGVEPPDFHAVAEVFLGGAWHLVDATGMAQPGAIAIIGVGRDAGDVSFLTAFGYAALVAQTVSVTAL
ncbi:MAG: transglutaminase-like domain-containing protein [Novosphingobium sp.]